jgi:hypothetical protein
MNDKQHETDFTVHLIWNNVLCTNVTGIIRNYNNVLKNITYEIW